MSAGAELRSAEGAALNNNQIISNVSGRNKKSKKGFLKKFGATGFITIIIIVFAGFFSSGNLLPSAISERIVEETDMQYADGVESKKLVFQQALLNGELPDDTVEILKSRGVLVGYESDEGFVETNNADRALSLKMNDKIITAENFVREVSSDVTLYNAFTDATYSRAAYYYDESAEEVFRKIGTSRNNFDSDKSFDEVMDEMIGEGSDIKVNGVRETTVTREYYNRASGQMETENTTEYVGMGADANSEAMDFIEEVRSKNLGNSATEAALNSADSLKVADSIAKEQRSSLFYLGFMENISKMKAGEGNNSRIHDAMNYLYTESESEVTDVRTGEVVTVKGSAVESPSLYAILSGEKVNPREVDNYSSDRVLKVVENRIGDTNGGSAISSTVSSANSGVKGSIGRLLGQGNEVASSEALGATQNIINSSLIDNSYDTIKGINAGEFLANGAVNVGKELAKKSGGAAGDESAVKQYALLNSKVVAMDAAADRLNRSPFDATSKNTFLGSIIYDMAVNLKFSKEGSNSLLGRMAAMFGTVAQAASAIFPVTRADDADGFLTSFGDCESFGTIGAAGSAQCAEIATFDTTTLNDPYNNEDFIAFVNNNTTLNSNGARTINNNSTLAKYILYNNERETPLAAIDGGIVESLRSESSSIPFISDIVNMVKGILGLDEEERRIATNEAFVNSASNPDWQTYKYAQRYVSLARATAALRQYTNDKTAYNNIKFFEGDENPVVAFLRDYRIAKEQGLNNNN